MDSEKLGRFFRGESSPQEVEEVLAWFRSEELSPGQEQDLYEVWKKAENEELDEEKDKEFNQDTSIRILAGLNKAINEREEELSAAQSSGEEGGGFFTRVGQWEWMLTAAAAVLLPVCFLWLLLSYSSDDERGPVPKLVTVEASAGSRETITLEDGSMIVLNTGGKVSYLEPFPSQRREVTLSGEAFFEVAKDSLRPFVVRTGPLLTQALGTSFNISYRPREKEISVALATGAVQVEKGAGGGNGSHLARLEPGQQLVYDQPGQAYRIKEYDHLEVLGWREGILSFNKANLDQVIEKLEKWYGIDIQVMGSLGKEKDWHYTGTYDNQSLENVLEGISFVKRFSYERKGNKVIMEVD